MSNNNTANDTRRDVTARENTETKVSTKTTEFFVYVAAVVAIIITALVVGDNGDGGGEGGDPFGAEHAMRYITFLTIGYMIARGLAKSGSRYNTAAHDNN